MMSEVMDRDAIFSGAIALPTAEERDAFLTRACGEDVALRHELAARVAAHFQAGGGRNGTVAAVAPEPPPERNGQQAAPNPVNGQAPPGIPITLYCDKKRFALRPRLELFVVVCQAVQQAHHKGVRHGNLRSSSVLITTGDGKPVPKVTDFGATTAAADNLEYLSPEQAQANAPDVDARGDVYSLGVLLYELLTGTTPLTRQRLQEAGPAEALRLVREEQPVPPSTRLNESRDRLAALATQRQTDPAALLKAVRGELDAVVMKALQKDRTRRYETASELARDVQRYLADEPVEAYPGGSTYRLRKLARQHRRASKLVAALLLLLLGCGVGGTLMALSASQTVAEAQTAVEEAGHKRDEALKSEAALKEQYAQAEAARQTTAKGLDRALLEGAAAQRAHEDARAVLAFLQDRVFSAGRPKAWAGPYDKGVTLRKAVDAAEPEVARTFAGRPLAVAMLREILGAAYLDLDEAPRAVKQYEQALALRQKVQGPEDPDTVACRNNLARAYRLAGRTVEAGALYNRPGQQTPGK